MMLTIPLSGRSVIGRRKYCNHIRILIGSLNAFNIPHARSQQVYIGRQNKNCLTC
jgi:hypothetical protein